MDIFVNPSSVHGALTLPASKSQSIRAILFASLASSPSRIDNLLPSPDIAAAHSAAEVLASKQAGIIDVGNSGLVLRLFGAIAALQRHPITFTGDHSIQNQRSVQPLTDGLRQLGATVAYQGKEGFAPFIVQGPIQGGKIKIEGGDSQPVSGLLIASAFAEGNTEILVEAPGELPWVALTLKWMKRLGLNVEHDEYRHYWIPGSQTIQGFEYTVAGDLSSLAFPLAAALVTDSELTITRIDRSDGQGDGVIIDIAQAMGANLRWDAGTLHVLPSSLRGIEIDCNPCIDALPILAVLGCYARGTTRLRNAAIARTKESNRIAAMARELSAMGAAIHETHDGLVIEHSPLNGAILSSHADHRVAMSLAVAALGASGPSQICDVACIAKTYPNFVLDFHRLGALISFWEEERSRPGLDP